MSFLFRRHNKCVSIPVPFSHLLFCFLYRQAFFYRPSNYEKNCTCLLCCFKLFCKSSILSGFFCYEIFCLCLKIRDLCSASLKEVRKVLLHSTALYNLSNAYIYPVLYCLLLSVYFPASARDSPRPLPRYSHRLQNCHS